MRLKKLTISNFVGIEEAELSFEKPVTLTVGRNNQGKSTIRDAIQFALTGRCRAMRFGKEVGHVVRGVNGMLVELDYIGNDGTPVKARRSKSTVGHVDERPVLRYCLNPAEFIALTSKERAKVLSDVLGGGLDDVIRSSLAEHIGDVDETVLSELKASGVSLLDVDAFRKQIVEQRRSYKRIIEALPEKAPLLGDYELDADYDLAKDQGAVTELAARIAKGADLIAQARKMVETKAAIFELTKAIEKLEAARRDVPNLPRGVSKDKLNMAPIYLTIMETMLSASDTNQCECPVCASVCGRKETQKLHDEVAGWYEKYQGALDERAQIIEENGRIDRDLESKTKSLADAKARLKVVDVPKGGEDLLAKLQAERDAAQKRMGKHQLWDAAMKAFEEAGHKRAKLEALVTETNRIDEALKDGGAVKSAIAAGGRTLPINDSLLGLWDMTELAWSDNGEITLRDIPIEYASASEQYRAACVMGMALAEVSGVGIAALDGFEILDGGNANAFIEAVEGCKLNNVLVLASTEKDYSQAELPEWLDIFRVERGQVAKL